MYRSGRCNEPTVGDLVTGCIARALSTTAEQLAVQGVSYRARFSKPRRLLNPIFPLKQLPNQSCTGTSAALKKAGPICH
jgi:hypothetical protein